MSDDAPTSALQRQTICIACGYDLVGIPEEGLCPECGLSFAESLRHIANAKDNERPLREIAEGLTTIQTGYAVLLGAVILSFVAANFANSLWILSTVLSGIAGLMLLFVVFAMIFGHAGVATSLTTPDGRTPRLNHSSVTGVGVLGVVLTAISAFPLGLSGVGSFALVGQVFAAILGFAGVVLLGISMLARLLAMGGGRSAFLLRSSAAGKFAAALCFVNAALLTTLGLGLIGDTAIAIARISLPTTAVLSVIAHAAMVLALSRIVRRLVRQLPPTPPPAAL